MGAGYNIDTVGAFNQRLEQEFSALPGVKSVGIALYSALEGNNWGEGVYVEGRPAPGRKNTTALPGIASVPISLKPSANR